MKNIFIGNREVGQGRGCFLIAEIAQAHDGSLGIAHSYIDAVADAGVDAIKFQTHIAEAESTRKEKFRVNFSYEDSTRYDYWKRMEFTERQWLGLKDHCDSVGIIFLSSAFSVEAVQMLEKIGMPAWKVGSGEVNNPLIIDAMLKTSSPILLSSGMSDWDEIDDSVALLRDHPPGSALFQCTSRYPARLKEVGLNVVKDMKHKYNLPIGLSDHSGSTSPAFAAICSGVDLLEFHVVFDKKMFGPDSQSSLDFGQLREVIKFREDYLEMQNNPVDKDSVAEEMKTMKGLFNKSLVLKRALAKGSILQRDDFTAKKPGTGIAVQFIDQCVGKTLVDDFSEEHFLSWDDMET